MNLNRSFKHTPSTFEQLMQQYCTFGFKKQQILKAWQQCGFNMYTFHEELIKISEEESINLSKEDLLSSQIYLKKQLKDLEDNELKNAIQLSIDDQNQQPLIEENERANKQIPVGLMNLGNTCYMNAILQSLFNSIPFRQLVFSIDLKENSTLAANFLLNLQKLILLLQETTKAFTNPFNLFEALQKYKPNSMLIKGVQNDFNELLNAFLDGIEQALKDIGEEVLKKQFCQMFYGESKEILSYKEKEQEVIKVTTTSFGSISIDAQDRNLEKGFLNTRILIIDEFETNTKEKTKAKIDQIILQPPNLLQFYINRVYYDTKQKLPCKNNLKFDFPSQLNINQFKASDAKSMNKELLRLAEEEQKVLDELKRYGDSKDEIEENFSRIIKLFRRGEGQLDQPLIIDDFQICDENTSNQELISSQKMLFQLENYKNKFLKSIQLLTDRLEQIQIEKKQLLKSDQNIYFLTAVLMHDGGATCGHYYSYILDKNDYKTWWKCNDTVVTKVDYNQVVKDATGNLKTQSNVSGLLYEQENWMKSQKISINPKLLKFLDEEKVKSNKSQDLKKVINRKAFIIQSIQNYPLKTCKNKDSLNKEFEKFSDFELFLSINHPNLYKYTQTQAIIQQDLNLIKDQLFFPQNIQEYITYFIEQSKLLNTNLDKELLNLKDEFLKVNSVLQQLPLKDLTQSNFQENIYLFAQIMQQIPQKDYYNQLSKNLKDLFQIMLLKGCFLIDLSIQSQDLLKGTQIAQQILSIISDSKFVDDIFIKQIKENLKSSGDQAKLLSKRSEITDQFTNLKNQIKMSIILKLLNFKPLDLSIQQLQSFKTNGLQLWIQQADQINQSQKLLLQQDRLNAEAIFYFQG